jgi:hypothetical protein
MGVPLMDGDALPGARNAISGRFSRLRFVLNNP